MGLESRKARRNMPIPRLKSKRDMPVGPRAFLRNPLRSAGFIFSSARFDVLKKKNLWEKCPFSLLVKEKTVSIYLLQCELNSSCPPLMRDFSHWCLDHEAQHHTHDPLHHLHLGANGVRLCWLVGGFILHPSTRPSESLSHHFVNSTTRKKTSLLFITILNIFPANYFRFNNCLCVAVPIHPPPHGALHTHQSNITVARLYSNWPWSKQTDWDVGARQNWSSNGHNTEVIAHLDLPDIPEYKPCLPCHVKQSYFM